LEGLLVPALPRWAAAFAKAIGYGPGAAGAGMRGSNLKHTSSFAFRKVHIILDTELCDRPPRVVCTGATDGWMRDIGWLLHAYLVENMEARLFLTKSHT